MAAIASAENGMTSLNEKTVVVTGAARGIGRALATGYGERGARLVLADVDNEGVERTAQALRRRGVQVEATCADIGSEPDAQRVMDIAMRTFGTIDILINNAGFSRFKPVYELTGTEWDETVTSHLRGTFLCSREAARRMRQSGNGGSIVNIASTRALMSEPGSEAYAAAKGGVVALTHALALSLGPDRIRVNCISPGWICTGDHDELRAVDHEQHPAGRVGRPDDVLRACLYLSDPDNDFVTGVNLVVDGGMTRKMIYAP